jgi:hypothetical protein
MTDGKDPGGSETLLAKRLGLAMLAPMFCKPVIWPSIGSVTR